ncbi:MAG: PEP-CTERM sorting domain-containing protein [Verrucomicrobia bacterium]|nr:PEP-CTERM sorting domain-containing protein [Verrucomicrobiota bacterium]
MKITSLAALIVGLAAATAIPAGAADLATNTFTFAPNMAIPDNSLVGVADSRTVAGQVGIITNLNVSLNISGGYVGDLYGYLTYGSQFAILLNREGRTSTSPYGYLDSGLNVTLSDSAVNGDIHTYRLVVNPGGGALTGMWQPDGRSVHPYNSLDTTPRTAMLNSFQGLDPNGTWTLYLADASGGGISTLNSWSLEIITVPEPRTWALFAVGTTLMFWLRRKKNG